MHPPLLHRRRPKLNEPVEPGTAEAGTGSPTDAEEALLGKVLQEVADQAGVLGVDVVDISANIESVARRVTDQAAGLEELSAAADEILRNNHLVASNATDVENAAKSACSEVETSRVRVDASLDEIGALVETVTVTATSLSSLSEELGRIDGLAASIDDIAKQTHLLALNARIEAARSDSPGFSVIAEEVRKLADRTIESAGEVSATLAHLTDRINALVAQSHTARTGAEHAGEQTRSIVRLIDGVSAAMSQIGAQAGEIAGAAADTENELDGFHAAVVELTGGVAESSHSLDSARDRVGSLLDGAERLIQTTARGGVETTDTPFVNAVIETAARIGSLFEAALASGEISAVDLWDERYEPVPGSDPVQVTTRYLELTDRLLPPIQEPLLGLDERVAFCAAVDRNGYLPTHNLKFSKPQGRDAIWNAANCRNRRIFDDRTGLACGRNTEPFLLQTYRRDMGGTFVLMKDASAPIWVNGRHWGGFRMGFRA